MDTPTPPVANLAVHDAGASKSGTPSFHLKVYSPFNTYFDAEAYSISAENDTGPFDVLPHHKNFMTLLNPCDLHIVTPHDTQVIRISKGIMHVKADEVTVFLDV